jgi:hypothetical protein
MLVVLSRLTGESTTGEDESIGKPKLQDVKVETGNRKNPRPCFGIEYVIGHIEYKQQLLVAFCLFVLTYL